MEWLSQNWTWLAFGAVMIFMMRRGGAGGGCCGGHSAGDKQTAGAGAGTAGAAGGCCGGAGHGAEDKPPVAQNR